MNKKDAVIQTYTGKMINPFYPDENLICIEDIAHSLSMQCRFNGNLKRFYSVGEHSIYVSIILRKMGLSLKTQLLGLLHDASETYLSDIPAPIKEHLPDYLAIEKSLSTFIYKKLHPQFGDITVNDFYYIDIVDKEIAILEGRKLLGISGWNSVKTSFDIEFDTNLTVKEVKDMFLALYSLLREEIVNEPTRNKSRD